MAMFAPQAGSILSMPPSVPKGMLDSHIVSEILADQNFQKEITAAMEKMQTSDHTQNVDPDADLIDHNPGFPHSSNSAMDTDETKGSSGSSSSVSVPASAASMSSSSVSVPDGKRVFSSVSVPDEKHVSPRSASSSARASTSGRRHVPRSFTRVSSPVSTVDLVFGDTSDMPADDISLATEDEKQLISELGIESKMRVNDALTTLNRGKQMFPYWVKQSIKNGKTTNSYRYVSTRITAYETSERKAMDNIKEIQERGFVPGKRVYCPTAKQGKQYKIDKMIKSYVDQMNEAVAYLKVCKLAPSVTDLEQDYDCIAESIAAAEVKNQELVLRESRQYNGIKKSRNSRLAGRSALNPI